MELENKIVTMLETKINENKRDIEKRVNALEKEINNLDKEHKLLRDLNHGTYTQLNQAVQDTADKIMTYIRDEIKQINATITKLGDRINSPLIWLITVMGGTTITTVIAIIVLLFKK